MQYLDYGYLWPPRPEQAIPAGMFGFYEKQGWVGQIKKNGTCSLIFAKDEVIFKTRHNDEHKAWKPSLKHTDFFKKLANGKWCVFEAELLHSKGGEHKDTFYIFDILVWKNEYLVGTTFVERQEMLMDIFPDRVDNNEHYWDITPNILLAKPITGNFKAVWDGLTSIEDEGIVLKDPKARLKLCNKPSSNSGWQFKCRRPHKNYSF